MSKRLAVYSSKAVNLVAADLPINDGRADEFVSCEPDQDAYSDEVSPDGAVCRYETGNTLWTVTVKLKGYSAENAKLSALHALDTNSPNGAGIGAFLLKDNNGSTLMAADKCWISKHPGGTFGKTRGDVEWKFRVVATVAQMVLGGN